MSLFKINYSWIYFQQIEQKLFFFLQFHEEFTMKLSIISKTNASIDWMWLIMQGFKKLFSNFIGVLLVNASCKMINIVVINLSGILNLLSELELPLLLKLEQPGYLMRSLHVSQSVGTRDGDVATRATAKTIGLFKWWLKSFQVYKEMFLLIKQVFLMLMESKFPL